MTTRNADNLIVQEEAKKLGQPIPETPVSETKAEEEKPLVEDKSKTAHEQKSADPETPTPEKEEPEEEPLKAKKDEASDDSEDDVDEYGTKVEKKKLYTEEEVQNMIRERFSRGQWANQNIQTTQEQQQQVQKEAENFQPDPNSSDGWEVQLEDFIKKTINKITNETKEEEWKRQEAQRQADFELKFSEGMGKYKDFNKTVAGKPITAAMMLATRTMKDPAAFVYAACKQHPKEIERISQIPDAYAQSVEIGRLEERMKKAKTVTASPKPSTKVQGDMSDDLPKRNIDSLINEHAKTKVRR